MTDVTVQETVSIRSDLPGAPIEVSHIYRRDGKRWQSCYLETCDGRSLVAIARHETAKNFAEGINVQFKPA